MQTIMLIRTYIRFGEKFMRKKIYAIKIKEGKKWFIKHSVSRLQKSNA